MRLELGFPGKPPRPYAMTSLRRHDLKTLLDEFMLPSVTESRVFHIMRSLSRWSQPILKDEIVDHRPSTDVANVDRFRHTRLHTGSDRQPSAGMPSWMMPCTDNGRTVAYQSCPAYEPVLARTREDV